MDEKYVSRDYLLGKWEPLKWDMENLVLAGDGDKVPEDVVARTAYNIIDKCRCIAGELGKGV